MSSEPAGTNSTDGEPERADIDPPSSELPGVIDVSGAPPAPKAEDFAALARELLPDSLDALFVVGSGSEANDLALRLARHTSGGKGIIVTRRAFHGTTVETAAISPAVGGLAAVAGWVRVVDPPSGDGHAFAAAVRTAAYELRDSEYGFAAAILDPIFASDGVHRSVGLDSAVDAVHDAGGLVIIDETGLVPASVGPKLWAFESSGIVPDILTFAPGAAGTIPIAVVATDSSRDIGPSIDPTRYRGTDASLSAAERWLSDIRASDAGADARSVGDYLAAGLALVGSAGSSVSAVRARGLHIALDSTRSAELVDALAEHGVIVGRCSPETLVITAPLGLTTSSADVLIQRFYSAMLGIELAG